MKVLIVEDEALIALSFAQMAREAGHRVVGICKTLPDAQALAATDPPDLALVDLRLGDRRCGAKIDLWLNETYGTLSVYVTANRGFAYTYRTRAPAFLEKPVSAATVKQTLRWMEARRRGEEVPPPSRLVLFETAETA
ncbi:MAG TPA: response regulator [Azospirillaceae bacterium]|nr:response regulator [Azospirillaceae bacterium]